MAAAPSSRARTSSPMTAAGSRPAGVNDREAAAHVVGDGQDVFVGVPVGLAQGAELAAAAGHGDDQLPQPLRLAAVELGGLAAENPVGHGRFQGARPIC